jgi:hypothetical protein
LFFHDEHIVIQALFGKRATWCSRDRCARWRHSFASSYLLNASMNDL